MSDFFQNGIITTLHDFGTAKVKGIEAVLSDPVKRREIALILPIIPRDLNSSCFKDILAELVKAPYISEVVLSLGQTTDPADMVEARRCLRILPQRHAVVWSTFTSRPAVRTSRKNGASPAARCNSRHWAINACSSICS